MSNSVVAGDRREETVTIEGTKGLGIEIADIIHGQELKSLVYTAKVCDFVTVTNLASNWAYSSL